MDIYKCNRCPLTFFTAAELEKHRKFDSHLGVMPVYRYDHSHQRNDSDDGIVNSAAAAIIIDVASSISTPDPTPDTFSGGGGDFGGGGSSGDF